MVSKMSEKKYSDLNDLQAMLEDLQEEDKRLNNVIIDLTNDLAKLKTRNNFLLDIIDKQHQLLTVYYNRLYETEAERR